MQVRLVNEVVVDEHDATDAGPDERGRRGATEAAHADEEHRPSRGAVRVRR